MAAVEVHHGSERGLLDMFGTDAYRRPTVRVHLVGQWAYEVLHVAVGEVEMALLELFDDHPLLHLYVLPGESKAGHAVRFQPESGFHIATRHGDVVVGEVVVCPGVVLASGKLYVGVVVGDIDRAFEHQML